MEESRCLAKGRAECLGQGRYFAPYLFVSQSVGTTDDLIHYLRLEDPEYVFAQSWRSAQDLHGADDLVVYQSQFSLPIARWTKVPLDNEILNRILLLFWTWDCAANRVIDRTMFEDDMRRLDPMSLLANEPFFYSPFLVNSLLALACIHTSTTE